MKRRYRELGLGLLLGGLGLVPTAYLLLNSIPIIALGMALVILGAVCLALARTRPRISPEVSRLLLETGVENLNSLLEELGLRSKGIYLPSSLSLGKPRAIIPLHSNPRLPDLNIPLKERLIVSCGVQPEDLGIMVTTAGSSACDMLETKPGETVEEIATALTTVLVGNLDLASSVKVSLKDSRVEVKVSHPRLSESRNSWVQQSLGSPVASIVAALVAEALDKPVVIQSETLSSKEHLISLEIFGVPK